MATDNAMKFKHSNLYFLGTKMDVNGNGVYMFKFPNQRAFSIQNHNFWQGSYFRLTKSKPESLFDKNRITPNDLEELAIAYIKLYGSDNQRKSLREYK